MHKFGPIVNVDESKSPFKNSRRLVTNFDVKGDAKVAHSSVQPGRRAYKDKASGEYRHESVWKYLFTHPVDEVGIATPTDEGCEKHHKQ